MKFLTHKQTRINCSRILANGKLTNVIKIVLSVYRNKQISRVEVLREILDPKKFAWAKDSRSYYNGMFAAIAMNEIIQYNPKTRKYESGPRMGSYLTYLRENNVLPELL